MKKCPYCAEEIQDDAKVCRFCGRDLNRRLPTVKETDASLNRRNTQRALLVFGGFAVVAGLIVSFAAMRAFGDSALLSTQQSKAEPVVYYVSGSTPSASLTYQAPGGSTEQQGEVSLSWRQERRGFRRGDFLYISAQNKRESGCVRVAIWKNGAEFKVAESCGAFVIATASGSF